MGKKYSVKGESLPNEKWLDRQLNKYMPEYTPIKPASTARNALLDINWPLTAKMAPMIGALVQLGQEIQQGKAIAQRIWGAIENPNNSLQDVVDLIKRESPLSCTAVLVLAMAREDLRDEMGKKFEQARVSGRSGGEKRGTKYTLQKEVLIAQFIADRQLHKDSAADFARTWGKSPNDKNSSTLERNGRRVEVDVSVDTITRWIGEAKKKGEIPT